MHSEFNFEYSIKYTILDALRYNFNVIFIKSPSLFLYDDISFNKTTDDLIYKYGLEVYNNVNDFIDNSKCLCWNY